MSKNQKVKAKETKESRKEEIDEVDDKDEAIKGTVPFWSWTNMDDPIVWKVFIAWRFF